MLNKADNADVEINEPRDSKNLMFQPIIYFFLHSS